MPDAPPLHEPFRWRPRQVMALLAQAGKEWVEDKAPKQAAALAYYALFALGPILFIAIVVAGFAFGQEAARAAIAGQFGHLVGPEGAKALDALAAGAFRGRAGAIGIAVGAVLLLFGAIGVFAQLREALNAVWEVEPKRARGWKARLAALARRNVLGLAGVLGVAFLLLVSLVVSTAIASLAKYGSAVLPGADWAWQGVNLVLMVGVCTGLFALMYRHVPDAKVAWRDTLFGAFATGILFVLGELLIGFYLGQAATASRYAAVGAAPVLLLWIYYSGLVLFYGAELTQVYANRHGAAVRPSRRAQPIQEAVATRQRLPSREGTRPAPKVNP